MSDFLVRGLPTPLLDKLGDYAAKLGVSRQVYIKRLLTDHALTLPPDMVELVEALSEKQAKDTLLSILWGLDIYAALRWNDSKWELTIDKQADL